jgi:hypothetical protein
MPQEKPNFGTNQTAVGQSRWIDRAFSFFPKTPGKLAECSDNIVTMDSAVTPGTSIKLHEQKPWNQDREKHYHEMTVQLTLPLTQNTKLEVDSQGEKRTFARENDFDFELDFNSLGGHMDGNIPVLDYQGHQYIADDRDPRIIKVPLEDGNTADFVVINPKDRHSLSSADDSSSAFFLDLSFPAKPGVYSAGSLACDLIFDFGLQ